jgi:hypothetical protein
MKVDLMMRHLAIVTALLALSTVEKAGAVPLLAVDVNDRQTTDAPDSVPGFGSFLGGAMGASAAITAPVTQMINGYSVTLAPFDDLLDENTSTAGLQDTLGAIDDRDRTTPTNAGALTFAQIYDDFIFAGASTGFTGGMDLAVSGGSLMPNTQYFVSIYSFDTGSTAAPVPRTAAWTDGNNANALVLTTSFDGAASPTTDNQYRFTGIARTSAAGALLLRGRNTIPMATAGGVTPGVFLNAFEINAVPEPASLSLMSFVGVVMVLASRSRRGLVAN